MAGILKDLTQKGGGYDIAVNDMGQDDAGNERGEFASKEEAEKVLNIMNETKAKAKAKAAEVGGGRRRRHSKGHRGNSWLTHVKATMKLNRGKSFKQVLKLAKKSYKKSQSQSGGKGRKVKSVRKGQRGGSGGKIEGLSGSPYV
jgi:hypothetical protein